MNKVLKNNLFALLFVAVCLMFFSCKNDIVPKPAGFLRLDYQLANYKKYSDDCPFEFEINENAILKKDSKCGFSIEYPKMKATIYLTYKPVQNNIKNLLRDAQKLTYNHVIKADDIIEHPFLNKNDKVYGMFYQVDGNAATNSQFYATDSTKHFLTASLYFYTKPNFDSMMPAASYVKNDMQKLLESVKWK